MAFTTGWSPARLLATCMARSAATASTAVPLNTTWPWTELTRTPWVPEPSANLLLHITGVERHFEIEHADEPRIAVEQRHVGRAGLLALDVDRAIAERQHVRIVDRSDHRAGERLPHIEGARLVDDDGDSFGRRTFGHEEIARVSRVRASPGAMQKRPMHRARKAPVVTRLIGTSDRAIPLPT